MKKRSFITSNILLFPGFIVQLFLLLAFSGCLILIITALNSRFQRMSENSNTNRTLQQYLIDTFPSSVDALYQERIDSPMEEFFNSGIATSFCFSTEQYPAEDSLLTLLKSNLNSFVDEHDYVSAAALYSSPTNTFVSNSSTEGFGGGSLDSFLYNMIYNYNSNTLDKNQITGKKSNTFLFSYQGYIVFSKDLTTLSGTPHATMFSLLSKEDFSSLIYQANASIPYQMSVFNPHGLLLFTNMAEDEETAQSRLARLLANESHMEQTENISYIYCSSELTKLQYVLEMNLLMLPSSGENSTGMYNILVTAAVALMLLILLVFYYLMRKPVSAITNTLQLTPAETRSVLRMLPSINERVNSLKKENEILQRVVTATSSEVVSHLFASLVAGQTIEEEEAEVILQSSGYGFQMNDVYAAGVLHQNTSEFIRADSRFQILNILNGMFDKFKAKEPCNLCAFMYDEKSFVLIASFPYGTSIAKGKEKLNILTDQLEETVRFSGLPMTIAFGHMYKSIWDLTFSYNEAFRKMHYQTELLTVRSEQKPVVPDSPGAISVQEASKRDEILPEPPAEDELTEENLLIDRRAYQLTSLLYDDHAKQAEDLLDRIMNDIFADDSFAHQMDSCKQLISAVTSHILTYPFMNEKQMTDVYQYLSPLLSEKSTPEEGKQHVRTAILMLCNDFSEALKKQRNPYIVGALDYISQHYSNPDLSLEEIAEYLKIAPNYLSTLFSKSLGKKLFEYVNEYRLDRSVELLLNTDSNVNEIAEQSGFGSSRNYIRIFKKYKDITPGAYRKQHLNSAPSISHISQEDNEA